MQKTEFVFVGRISSNGRVVIPCEIREILDLKDGDTIEVKITRVLKRASEKSERVFPRRGESSGRAVEAGGGDGRDCA